MIRQVPGEEERFEQNLLQRGIVRATYIVHNYGRDKGVTREFIKALIREGFNEKPVRNIEGALDRIATMTHNVLVERPDRSGLPSKADIADVIHQLRQAAVQASRAERSR